MAVSQLVDGQDAVGDAISRGIEQKVVSKPGLSGIGSDVKELVPGEPRGDAVSGDVPAESRALAGEQHSVPAIGGPGARTHKSKGKRRLPFSDIPEESEKQNGPVRTETSGQSAAAGVNQIQASAGVSLGKEDLATQLVAEGIDSSSQKRLGVFHTNGRHVGSAVNSPVKTRDASCTEEAVLKKAKPVLPEELPRGGKVEARKDGAIRSKVTKPSLGNPQNPAVPAKPKHSKPRLTPPKSETTNAAMNGNQRKPKTPAANATTPKGKRNKHSKRRNKSPYETRPTRKSINCCCEFECDYCSP